jgi:competence protein ComGF
MNSTDSTQYGRARWIPEWSHDAMKWTSVDQIALVRPDLYKMFSKPHTNTKIWIHQTLYEFVDYKDFKSVQNEKLPRIVSVLTEAEFMCAYDLVNDDKPKRRKNGRSRQKLRKFQNKTNTV